MGDFNIECYCLLGTLYIDSNYFGFQLTWYFDRNFFQILRSDLNMIVNGSFLMIAVCNSALNL